MDELTALLRDPETHEAVRRASEADIARVEKAIVEGRAKRHDGGELPTSIEGAYVSHSGRWVYPDVPGGIPSFLIEERIELDEPLG